jgi:hypothetical protein
MLKLAEEFGRVAAEINFGGEVFTPLSLRQKKVVVFQQNFQKVFLR